MITKPVLRRPNTGPEVGELQRLLHLTVDYKFGPLTHEAVCTFQREQGLVADGIVEPKTWQALLDYHKVEQTPAFSDLYKGKLTASKRRIDDIVIHCTATRDGRAMSVEDIRRIHVRDNHWADIGYHYVILLDGTINSGRPVDQVGAHVAGHNAHSIGVVYVGGLDNNLQPADTRTERQRGALLALLKMLRAIYPKARIRGHRDFSPDLNHNGIIEPQEWIKACPCFDAKMEYKDI